MPRDNDISWWRHQMETFSALLAICAGTGEFPTQRPMTRSFDIFFDLRLNNRLSKQSWGWWFETPWRSLWRHCYVSLSQWGGNNAWPMLFFLMWHRTSHERTVTYHTGLHEFRDCITKAHMFFFNMKLLTSMENPHQTRLTPKSRKDSFVRSIFVCRQISLHFITDHGIMTAVLCVNRSKDSCTKLLLVRCYLQTTFRGGPA